MMTMASSNCLKLIIAMEFKQDHDNLHNSMKGHTLKALQISQASLLYWLLLVQHLFNIAVVVTSLIWNAIWVVIIKHF